MKKLLEQLTTSEFVAVILGISPRKVLEFNSGFGPYRKYEGTYDEILSAIRADRGLITSDYYTYAIEHLFDYDMQLERTDIIKYLRYRTEGFDPDLTAAFLKDMEQCGHQLINENKHNFHTQEEFDQWESSSASIYFRARDYLISKCERFVAEGLLEPDPFISHTSEPSYETEGSGCPLQTEQRSNKDYFIELLEAVIEKLGNDFFEENETTAQKWRYKKSGISLAYLGLRLKEESGLKSTPWKIIREQVYSVEDRHSLKEMASTMKKKQDYPEESGTIDAAIRSIIQG